MSDALPLPPRPNLEQYKKLARDFQHACQSSDSGAIRDWAAHWAETLAGLHEQPITEVRSEIRRDTERVERQWHNHRKSNERAARCTLADAQFFVARCHGFASWPKFAKHLEELARAESPVSNFEHGGGRDRQRRRSGTLHTAARRSGIGTRPLDPRASLHPPPLHLRQRCRGLPPEDAGEHSSKSRGCYWRPAPTSTRSRKRTAADPEFWD